MRRIVIGPVLMVSLVTACVGGAQVFDPDRDGGPPAPCARAASAPRHEGAISLGPGTLAELGRICIPPALAIDGHGAVDCVLTFRLPTTEPASCDAFAGLTLRGTETYATGEAATVCDVHERTAPTEPGWAYVLAEDFDDMILCGRLEGAIDVSRLDAGLHGVVDWSCAVRDGAEGNSLGSPCSEAVEPTGFLRGDSPDWDAYRLSCDPVTHQLNLACDDDADCAGAGLDDDRCGAHGFCVPSTCG